jgi:uncharacterized protein YbjT (DUF2867 family)
MRLLVTGGTGTAGTAVVRQAVERGHEVVVLSRQPSGTAERGITQVQGDLIDPGTLPQALAGVDTVIDCTNIATLSRRKATTFFQAEVRNVLAAGAVAGLRRYVLLSIVGIDRFPSPYYAAKLAQEGALSDAATAAGIGHAIVRSSQFHDYAALSLEFVSLGPIALVQPVRCQPIDISEVAEHLISVAESDTTGQTAPIAGPLPESLIDMARRLVAQRGERKWVVPLPLSPGAAKANRARALIPEAGLRGRITYADWLARQPGG